MSKDAPKSIEAIDWSTVKIVDDHGRQLHPAPRPEDYKPQKIAANKGATVEFDGKLLAEVTTQNKQRTKARWTELRLWETPRGAWIAESVGCSDDDGHVDIIDAGIFRIGDGVEPREIQIMNWFGWSYAARALASKLDWDLTVRVE